VFLRVLGWLGIVVPVLIAVTQQGAFAEYSLQKGGSPYYYSGYPGPPAWFWILVFPGFIAGLVFLPFSTWLNNSYKEANAKLRNRQG
jgi:hypothetical protein